MRVLFITRKYPPRIGGMELFSFELYRHLTLDKELVASSQGKAIEILWLAPWLFFRSWVKAPKFDIIYLADGVLAPIGWLLKKLTRRPVVATVHGLELTFKFPGYQGLIKWSLAKLDKVVCVSENSLKLAKESGLKPDRLVKIPNGISINTNRKKVTRQDFSDYLGRETKEAFVMLTIGRQVKRKGIEWFIREVCPRLSFSWLYCLVGQGPETKAINQAIQETGAQDSIIQLGQVSESDKDLLLDTSDCFVMPNIKVPNDVEGFGLVALEAAGHGLSVLASRLEGIRDAIHHNKNGLIISPEKADEWLKELVNLFNHPNIKKDLGVKAKEYTINNFQWPNIRSAYERVFIRKTKKNDNEA
ncbi:MAG: glycosyltransferase family 4 protein [bacterium]